MSVFKSHISHQFTDQPYNVTILNKDRFVRAGKQHKFVCMAFGSRPAATLTWWFGDLQVNTDDDHVQVVS